MFHILYTDNIKRRMQESTVKMILVLIQLGVFIF